ncbi:ABC transporter ATP-binding protein [Halobellus ruber]|uniref:ABC transporter ATP-binding protein n=1 Tax=Halobellus ruber TaxID=2761102 RepID=A0A7J9SHD1_9EURY|nr:ABC transporter ATP-binding protein [Halobellus ruber]MBB6645416.1 ABC transporter ATP-binding protein [Halobellus ruber]
MATREEQSTDPASEGDPPDSEGEADPAAADAPDSDVNDGGRREAGGAAPPSTAPGTDVPAVAVSGVSKRFGTGPDAVTAVNDVSVEIEAGSIVGLLGPNGAGKTTLIKSILGMVLPDEGSVRLHGIDVRARPKAAYAHVDAMLEGARNDYWRLTVRENLRYFATIGGVDPDSVADRHDRLLDRFGLKSKIDTPVRNLSRGMKGKVSLASVLAGAADVVFLDEPTLGLDVESSRTLQSELRRVAEERGLTVVVSSHDMDVVEAVCDRVLIMSDGRIVADDSVETLLADDDRHTLRIVSHDLGPALRADLRREFDVVGADTTGGVTRIEVAIDTDDLYALVRYLREHGVTIDDLETIEPDLEDVFVELTRDGEGSR